MKKIKVVLTTMILLSSVAITPVITLASEFPNLSMGTFDLQNKEDDMETSESESGNLKTSDPESVDPETSESENVAPETSESESVAPETSESENVAPETSESENVAPETSESENVAPETSESESVVPENESLKPSKPQGSNTNSATHLNSETQEQPDFGITGGVISITPNQTSQEFVDMIGPLAEEVAEKNDLYASVMIAQAALESAFGKSALASAPNYNLFGIKGSYNSRAVNFSTLEDAGNGAMYSIYANFRKYPSYKESLEDYAYLMKHGISGNSNFYNGVWKKNAKTYQKATSFLTGKYATDINYDKKLNGIISAYNLTQYDEGTVTKDRTYKVKKNDSLEKIAKKYKVKLDKVISLNKKKIKNPNLIFVGQTVIIEKGKKVNKKTDGKGNSAIVSYARQFFGVPYVWGGTTPSGFDCSGLVQYVYAKAGRTMPRVTTQQEHEGVEVAISNAVPGDLLFWGEKGQTYHVAIYSGNGNMIMAPQPGDVVKEMPVSSFMPDFAMHTV